MTPADAESSTNQDETGIAIAEGDERIGKPGAALDVAMLPHQVLAVGRDLPGPPADAVNAKLKDLGRDVAHEPDGRTSVLLVDHAAVMARVRLRWNWGGLRGSNP